MSNLPSPVFPGGVDPPIVQNANGPTDKAFFSYANAQIRALEQYAIGVSSVSVAGSFTFTSGQLAQQAIVLAGNPAAFVATVPVTVGTPFFRLFVNETSALATLTPSGGGTSATIPPATGAWVVCDATGDLVAIASTSGGGGGGGGGGPTGYPSLPTTAGYWALSSSAGGAPYAWVTLTQNIIGAGFTPTLALASGGAGPFEIGATWTPTFNATPATNSGTLTAATIEDNQGNGPTASSSANPLNAPSSSHHYTLTSPGTVTVTVTEVQTSPLVSANTNGVSAAFEERMFIGVGTVGATGAAASGNNAALVGATGTLSGSLQGNAIGFSGTVSPSVQKVYVLVPHTATPHTFVSLPGSIPFIMSAPTTITFTNQLGLAGISMDLYESTSILSATFDVQVAP